MTGEIKNMITMFSWKVFYESRAKDLLPLQCEHCGNTFFKEKRRIQSAMSLRSKDRCNYCDHSCAAKHKGEKITLHCGECGKEFSKNKGEIKPTKTNKHFCSKKCLGRFLIKV